MQRKRHQPPTGGDEAALKRARLTASQLSETVVAQVNEEHHFAASDFLSSLSDELLIRILSFLPTSTLLGVAPVSRRLDRLSADSQLWRTLYYHRFVLPRALRIPGFRQASAGERPKIKMPAKRVIRPGGGARQSGLREGVDWKRQYRLRHNWAQGNATVQELGVAEPRFDSLMTRRTLVKVVEGIAVTADAVAGLRAWDLRTRKPMAQLRLQEGELVSEPTCMAIDDQHLELRRMDVSVGFVDGGFGIWRLCLDDGRFLKRHRHKKSSSGQLIAVAYHHPLLLTATESVSISLYNFGLPPLQKMGPATPQDGIDTDAESGRAIREESGSELEERHLVGRFSKNEKRSGSTRVAATLPNPYLLTSLKSQTSQSPLALSIRRISSHLVASIAYIQPAREGWSIGIQDLHVALHASATLSSPKIVSTRLAFTGSYKTSSSTHCPSDGNTPAQQRGPSGHPSGHMPEGPTTLCYNHPYLLAVMADNTLILHICTSDASKLSISAGVRLWGHTSGIGDADITARGKAVSVSCRGEEIRVWDLEGRVHGKSIEVRSSPPTESEISGKGGPTLDTEPGLLDGLHRWVGFDDEMVIVLKETKHGRESLVVYDFS